MSKTLADIGFRVVPNNRNARYDVYTRVRIRPGKMEEVYEARNMSDADSEKLVLQLRAEGKTETYRREVKGR
jgi:hypothetical protein